MLVLNVSVDGSVYIGPEIRIFVRRVWSGYGGDPPDPRARLGFDAPRHLKILREKFGRPEAAVEAAAPLDMASYKEVAATWFGIGARASRHIVAHGPGGRPATADDIARAFDLLWGQRATQCPEPVEEGATHGT